MTDEDKKPIAEALYNFRLKHNLMGSKKTDWKTADRVILELILEDNQMQENGKVESE